MLGTSHGMSWAAVSSLVHSISCDQNKMFPCSVMLDGEYGLTDLCIGVPVILGRNGVKKIVELDLNDLETQKLNESARSQENQWIISKLKIFKFKNSSKDEFFYKFYKLRFSFGDFIK